MGALSGCGGDGCQRGSEGVEGGLVSADTVPTFSLWLCGMKGIRAFGLAELCGVSTTGMMTVLLSLLSGPSLLGAVFERLGCLSAASGVAV